MAECFPKDVLLRVGGATLHRFGYPAVAGSRRGPVELPLTFARADASTCATYIDRDGILRVAEANNLRREWVDLDGDGIRESPGLLLEGSQINLCLRSEDFANATWTKTGTPVTTTGETTLGVLSLDLLNDDDGAAVEDYEQVVAFTGDGVKGLLFHAKAGTAASTRVDVLDSTAGQSRGDFTITWTAGVPSVVSGGGGTLLRSELLSSGVYRFSCQVAAVVAANTNRIRVFPAGATGSATGTTRVGGMMTVNAAFPGSYVKTVASAVTRAADSLTLSANCGASRNLTAFSRIARPVHADASGSLGINPGIYTMGSTPPRVGGFFVQANRTLGALAENVAGTQATVAIPAGAEIKHIAQFKNLPTVPAWAVGGNADVGSFNTGATAFSAYANQTLRVGRYNDELFGVLLDLVIFGDLFTYAECSAVS